MGAIRASDHVTSLWWTVDLDSQQGVVDGCDARGESEAGWYLWIARLISSSQAPPLATLWTYTMLQLDLLPSFLSLSIVFGFTKLLGLKLDLRR